MSRAKVLRAVYTVLERNTDLTTALNHKVGAKSVDRGARILGDTVYLESIQDKLPLIILKVPSTIRARDGLRTSQMQIEVHGKDIFEVAEVLDLLETTCTGYRNNLYPDLPVTLSRLSALDDVPFDTGDPTIRIPLSTLTLEAQWISK